MQNDKINIGLMSDLHLEFERGAVTGPSLYDLYDNVDLMLLAGDLWTGKKTVQHPLNVAAELNVPTLWIAGNHEFYGGKIEKITAAFRASNVVNGLARFLENDVWVGEVRGRKIRVLGCTLWTDYDLFGKANQSKDAANNGLNDHRKITEDIYAPRYQRFRPNDAQKRHFLSHMWLQDELRKPFNGSTVVMAHHLPSMVCVHEMYKTDALTPAFASDLDDMISEFDIDLWVHGHTHNSVDTVVGGTRIVCNPRGYVGREMNSDFDPCLILEV